jgi:hydroxymethylpyrimidine/phosphomethylpyrimidine kinase
VKKVLTIAGSDCSGGAGIQADIKTITAHKTYAMSVITALTAQNTTGVHGIVEIDCEFVGEQLDCIFTDIFPDAVKIGMVSSADIIEIISQKLIGYGAKNIVIDPVMFSTSGHALISSGAMNSLVTKLLPLGDIITPNIPEAQNLCGFEIHTKNDMIEAARKISRSLKGGILIKGGHLDEDANDLLYNNDKLVWFEGKKIDNPNTHGTGCTLSSAIACNMANGFDIETCIKRAKNYITGSLNSQLNLGKGRGPLNHCYNMVIDN